MRRVAHDDDVGEFNRDFERYFLTGSLPLPVVVSLTGELWHATGADIGTWGASLAREFPEGLEADVGSQYALFEYDDASGEERQDVRTYYVDLRWTQAAASRWTLRYAFEANDFDDYQEVRLDWAWTF